METTSQYSAHMKASCGSEERFEAKFRGMLGPSSKDDKEVTILIRTVSWDRDGITYKADPRHVQIIVDELGLKEAKPVITPHADIKEEEGLDELLDDQRALRYRASVARIV